MGLDRGKMEMMIDCEDCKGFIGKNIVKTTRLFRLYRRLESSAIVYQNGITPDNFMGSMTK